MYTSIIQTCGPNATKKDFTLKEGGGTLIHQCQCQSNLFILQLHATQAFTVHHGIKPRDDHSYGDRLTEKIQPQQPIL